MEEGNGLLEKWIALIEIYLHRLILNGEKGPVFYTPNYVEDFYQLYYKSSISSIQKNSDPLFQLLFRCTAYGLNSEIEDTEIYQRQRRRLQKKLRKEGGEPNNE